MNLDQFIKDMFCKQGIQEAAGVEVTFKDGHKLVIHSDDHPALQQPAENVVSAKPTQTAQGG